MWKGRKQFYQKSWMQSLVSNYQAVNQVEKKNLKYPQITRDLLDWFFSLF